MADKILKNLKFEINKNVNFRDKKIQMVEAILHGEKFKRSDILDAMNDLAEQFNSNKIHIGCALHYKNINKMVSANMVPTTQAMELFDPYTAGESGKEYIGDIIDGLHFFIVNYNAVNVKKSFYTPKKT